MKKVMSTGKLMNRAVKYTHIPHECVQFKQFDSALITIG